MNEVVKYHNDLNTVPMRKWTREQMNFFFAIISKLRDESTREVEFDKHGLAELARYTITHNERFEDTMEKLVKNISQIHYIERYNNSLELMNLFSRFRVEWNDDLSEMSVKVKVTEEFEYVVNQLNVEFTAYELEEFTQIKSTYAKTMYRLLKQWRTVGKKEYSIADFKRLLDTPDYYGPSEIDKNILKPILKELPQFFVGLKVKKIKSNKRGTPVIAYAFSFKKEKSDKWIEGKYTSKPDTKKETLPEWAKTGYQHEEKELDDETRQKLERRLAEYEKNKHKKN